MGLGRCQSNDFDAQIADKTISMIQYILLSLKFRYDHYETKGTMFGHIRDGIIEARLNERLWGLFVELIRIMVVLFNDMDEMDLLKRILEDETRISLRQTKYDEQTMRVPCVCNTDLYA